MKKLTPKLSLTRVTVRVLLDDKLTRVEGGLLAERCCSMRPSGCSTLHDSRCCTMADYVD